METLKNIFTNKWTWITVGILGLLFLLFFPMFDENRACPKSGIQTTVVRKVNLWAILQKQIFGCKIKGQMEVMPTPV